MEVSRGENYFPVTVRIISDKTVPQCGQQKFKLCGVLNEDVKGSDDSFRRARKIATISFVLSVCLSGFALNMTFLYFREYVEKIQVSLKSDTYSSYFTRRPMYIYYILLNTTLF